MKIRTALLISAMLTAILFVVVDFAPDTSLVAKALMALFAWGFIAFGLWSMWDGIKALIGMPQDVKDLREASARSKRAKAAVSGAHMAQPEANAATGTGPPAALSAEEEAQMEGWLNAFIKAGIIDAAQFDESARAAVRASVAGWGEATPYATLMGIEEIGGGQMRAGGMLPALGFLDSKGEQLAEGFVQEVAMLDRVTGSVLGLAIVDLKVPDFDAMADTDIELDLRINGAIDHVRWRSAVKYSSTVLLVHVARAYHALGRGDALASLWSDQGSIVLRLTPGQYRAYNARMARQECADERFAWLHRDAPFASGEVAAP